MFRILGGHRSCRKANLSGRVLGQHLLDGDEVLQAFGHLAARDGQVAGVEEVPVGLSPYYGWWFTDMLCQGRKQKAHNSPGPAVIVKVSLALC